MLLILSWANARLLPLGTLPKANFATCRQTMRKQTSETLIVKYNKRLLEKCEYCRRLTLKEGMTPHQLKIRRISLVIREAGGLVDGKILNPWSLHSKNFPCGIMGNQDDINIAYDKRDSQYIMRPGPGADST